MNSSSNLRKIAKGESSYIHGKDVAQLIGISAAHVRRECEQGNLPGVRVGGAWYVSEEALPLYIRHKSAAKATNQVRLRAEAIEARRASAAKAREARLVVGLEILIRRR